jgi:hypothetical protein
VGEYKSLFSFGVIPCYLGGRKNCKDINERSGFSSGEFYPFDPVEKKRLKRLTFQCLSGRGDKDVEQISELLPKWADILDWHVSPHAGVKK